MKLYIYHFLLFVTLSIGVFLYSKIEKPFKLLVILISATFASEITAVNIVNFINTNSQVYQIFTVIEYFFFTKIYFELIKNGKLKKYIKYSFYIFFVICITNILFLQSFSELNTNTILLECYLIVTLSLLLFVDIRNNLEYENILKEELFWFNSVVFIFYSTNIIITGLKGLKVYNLKNPPVIIYDSLLWLLCIILYLTFGFTILKNAKKTEK